MIHVTRGGNEQVFCFNLFCRKNTDCTVQWLYKKNWQHACAAWFFINLAFNMPFGLLPAFCSFLFQAEQRSNYGHKGSTSVIVQPKLEGLCFPWSLSAGSGGTTAITGELYTAKEKRALLMEEAQTVRRERVEQEWAERSGVISL